jgi:lysophospholipase L1-like esterase
MHVRWNLRVAAAAAVVAGAMLFAAGARADADSATHYYLSLGDSLAESFQPNGVFDQGYAEQLYADLKAQDVTLKLVKLGCGGESTKSMRFGSLPPSAGASCGSPDFYQHTYPHKTQLAEAVSFLKAHAKHVSLVTIDIGGNEVGNCVATLDVGCFDAGLADVQAQLPQILGALRDAAGPDVPIVGMTYYDPFSVFWFASPAAGQAADGLVGALNSALEQIYTTAGAAVAQVDDEFAVGTFPASALHACQWTWMCAAPPLGPDIHPNAAGYGVIAQAFADVLSSKEET